MRQDLYNKYLSRPRYNRYLVATGNDKKRAERLYTGNLRLSQAFHPLLTQFEVVLRNGINNELTALFGDPEWIINQKAGFMSDLSLGSGRFFLRGQVQGVETKIRNRHRPVTSGLVISDLMFGFWTSLYLAHHYMLVGGRPIQVFPHKPAVEDRASIFSRLESIRLFRNRINHCEPICFNSNHIDCTEPQAIRDAIFDLVSWIEPDLVPFFEGLDNTQSKINQILAI